MSRKIVWMFSRVSSVQVLSGGDEIITVDGTMEIMPAPGGASHTVPVGLGAGPSGAGVPCALVWCPLPVVPSVPQ